MSQPSITYTLTWGANNVYQKLSGQTYTDPSGKVVDCNTLVVNVVAPEDFVKFYATAVKDGKDYGFVNDVLVDIEGNNPTGVKIHELNLRDAGNYSFTINATNHLIDGGGLYRIGLYIQQEDGTWNYEYFFVPVGHDYFDLQNLGDHLMVPVVTDPGEAYAVFDSDTGILTFFRDKTGKYSHGQKIGNKTYFTKIENKTSQNYPPWYQKNSNIQKVIIEDNINLYNGNWAFEGCYWLTEIQGIEKLNISHLMYADHMFNEALRLTVVLNITKMPESYEGMFLDAASKDGAQIILKYTDPVTSEDIDKLIATTDSGDNVINGGPA